MRIVWLALGFALWSKICQAHCRSGTVGMASHKALSFVMRSSIFSEMYCSDPMGVPNTVIPAGCHTSSPSSSMASGGIPARFQALVFPWCNWMPATRDNASSNNSYNTFTLEGSHKRYTSSKNAHNCSPGSNAAATSSSAPWIPMENKSGMRGSPCSPPSA